MMDRVLNFTIVTFRVLDAEAMSPFPVPDAVTTAVAYSAFIRNGCLGTGIIEAGNRKRKQDIDIDSKQSEHGLGKAHHQPVIYEIEGVRGRCIDAGT